MEKIRLQRYFFSKLATNEWSDKTFLLTSKLCPLGTVCPCPGLYTCIKSWKELYKIRLQRDLFLNLQQMTEMTRCSCWHQNFVPWGCLPLTCGYIHLLNHEKMCIKSEVEEILFKLATNDHSDEAFQLTSNFWPQSATAQGLCLNFFSSITADFNMSSQMVLWFKEVFLFSRKNHESIFCRTLDVFYKHKYDHTVFVWRLLHICFLRHVVVIKTSLIEQSTVININQLFILSQQCSFYTMTEPHRCFITSLGTASCQW